MNEQSDSRDNQPSNKQVGPLGGSMPTQRQDKPTEGNSQERNTTNKKRPPKRRTLSQRWRAMTIGNQVMAIATVVIATCTLAYSIIAGFQLSEIHSGSRDTAAIAKSAEAQAIAANTLAEQAKTQSGKMGESIAQLATQATAANNLAAEAKRSTDIANESLDEVRANFGRDQRPWAFVSGFKLSAEPEAGKAVSVRATMVNTGKSPALDIGPQSVVFILDAELGIVFPFPPLKASGRMTLQPSIGSPAIGGTTASFITSDVNFDNASIDRYLAKTQRLFIHARLSYSDAYGHRHWTAVCASHTNGKPLDEWNFCEQGNAVDPEEQKKPN